jgi:hypothetical protein
MAYAAVYTCSTDKLVDQIYSTLYSESSTDGAGHVRAAPALIVTIFTATHPVVGAVNQCRARV